MELVTVKTFPDMIRLGIVRSYLEDNGIECFVKDEYIGQVYSAITPFTIKLQIKEEDVQQAIRILIEGGFAKPEDYAIDKTMLKLSRLLEKFTSIFKGKARREY